MVASKEKNLQAKFHGELGRKPRRESMQKQHAEKMSPGNEFLVEFESQNRFCRLTFAGRESHKLGPATEKARLLLNIRP